MLVLGQPATQCSMEDTELWHTNDGATTWSKVDPEGLPFFQCKSTMAFVDGLHGFVGGYDTSTPASIHRTADGGRTWATAKLPSPPTADTFTSALRPSSVSAFGSSLVVVASGYTKDATPASYVFVSLDAGVTWTYVRPLEDGTRIVSPTRWLKWSTPYQESLDAGASWHTYATDYQQAAPITPALVFGDAKVGYATVRGGIQRTLDGGAHWEPIKTPGT